MNKMNNLIALMFDLVIESMKEADQDDVVEEAQRKAFITSLMGLELTMGDVCKMAEIVKDRAVAMMKNG
ncbi:MAG: hypothetical protein UX75_C0037G0005 [Candidatus Moranbacteria bacterium GW2011_GWE2_47_10]|nr:MAG: hypothetical protein UX75_C0037G0005 [Candidatus Moranbacteria bacterium GW2011_GWE2_47_10]